jgi:hypothetical protein
MLLLPTSRFGTIGFIQSDGFVSLAIHAMT